MPSIPPVEGSATVAVPDAVRDSVLEAVRAGQLDFPPLPEVATQVLRATQREDVSARELADLVRRDASLSANLLRVANSPMYVGTVSIVSVQQALSRLGLAQVREIALMVACRGEVFQVAGHQDEVKYVFRHSLFAALLCQQIARIKRTNPEEAFLAGLLHDVGRPLLMRLAVQRADALHIPLSKDALLALATEEHAKVGGLFCESWSLPAHLANTITAHHDTDPPADVLALARMIQFSDALTHPILRGETLVGLDTHPALSDLNLYPDDVNSLLQKQGDLLKTIDAMV